MNRLLPLLIVLHSVGPTLAIERNVAGQKLTLQVTDRSTGGPKTGDAANITAYVSIDGDTTPDALGDTTATELSSTNLPGVYQFDLTAAETNGVNIVYGGKSSTADVDIVARHIATMPAAFSAASQLGESFDNDGTGGDFEISTLSITGTSLISGTVNMLDGLAISRTAAWEQDRVSSMSGASRGT